MEFNIGNVGQFVQYWDRDEVKIFAAVHITKAVQIPLIGEYL